MVLENPSKGVRLPPPPPDYLPSIDKKNFIGGWFLFCLEILILVDFMVLGFSFFQFIMGIAGNFMHFESDYSFINYVITI